MRVPLLEPLPAFVNANVRVGGDWARWRHGDGAGVDVFTANGVNERFLIILMTITVEQGSPVGHGVQFARSEY